MFDNGNKVSAVREFFVTSGGWCEKFMARHAFSLRRNTASAQKDPKFLLDQIVSHVVHV